MARHLNAFLNFHVGLELALLGWTFALLYQSSYTITLAMHEEAAGLENLHPSLVKRSVVLFLQ